MHKAYRQPRVTFSKSTSLSEDKSDKVEVKVKDNGDVCAYYNGTEVGSVSKGSFLDFVTQIIDKDDDEEDIMEGVKVLNSGPMSDD